MKLASVLGNSQKLDGGAMFGNCPRALWATWCPPDDRNRIDLACRALLVVEPSGRLVLLETGIGAFFEPKLRERFGVVEERHVLIDSLARLGVEPGDVDVVVLSHLHFDHAGGALSAFAPGKALELAFPRAHWVVGEAAWQRAIAPHARDRASFIAELPALLEASGRLERVSGDHSATLGSAYSFTTSEGHTPGLLLTRVEGADEGPITFLGDLVPGVPWVHAPITMGYDRFPERLIDEKSELLGRMADAGEWAFFTHDPETAAARITRDEKGRFVAVDRRAALGGQSD